jgi:hypothetical protein
MMASSPDGSDDKDCSKYEEHHPDEGWNNPRDTQRVNFEMLETRHPPRFENHIEAEAY